MKFYDFKPIDGSEIENNLNLLEIFKLGEHLGIDSQEFDDIASLEVGAVVEIADIGEFLRNQ